MPLRTLALALLLLAAQAAALRAQAAPPGFREEFLLHFNSSSHKLLELARAMPEDRYAWSPGEGVMPVGRVYAHVARYNYHYPQEAMGIPAPAGTDLDRMEEVAAKAEVVELLRRSQEHVRASVRGLTDDQLARPTRLYGRDVPQWPCSSSSWPT
ncbi:MAG TPA: DinB family protein [Longimicrobiaceae bacterium]|nr:DinB family protein [Longimicrobiaceae bacterium]